MVVRLVVDYDFVMYAGFETFFGLIVIDMVFGFVLFVILDWLIVL